MSEEVSSATDAAHAPPPSFFAQHRLAIIGAGGFILVILFLMIGIAIGMTKKNFEKKFYLTQIEKLKEALTSSLDKRTELDKEISELNVELKAKKDHIRDLQDKVADLEHLRNKKEAAVSPKSAQVSQADHSSGATPDAGEAYLRLKAGDCLVEGSSGTTAANWKECLNNAKKTPAPGKTSSEH